MNDRSTLADEAAAIADAPSSPSSSPLPSPRLDHGAVGNGRILALISPTSAVDWLCLPRFDSPSVFGRLLDHARGGTFRFLTYTVVLPGNPDKLVFYKSRRAEKWWMEVESLGDSENKRVIPCTYEDYLHASQGDLPQRWIRLQALLG